MSLLNETPLAYLRAERAVGLGWDYFLLCFASERLIIAKTGHYNDTWAIIYNSFFNAPGTPDSTTFLTSAERSAERRAEELRQLNPQALVEADKSNLQIPYDDLRRITIRQDRRGALVLTLHSATREEWFALTDSRAQLEETAARLRLHLGNRWDFVLPPQPAMHPLEGWLAAHGITRWLITDMIFIVPIGLGVGAALGWGLGIYLNSVSLGPQTQFILAVLGAIIGLMVAGSLNPQFDKKQAAAAYIVSRLGDFFENERHSLRHWLEGLGHATFGAAFGLVHGMFHWRAVRLLSGAVLGYLVAGPHGWNPWQTAVHGAALVWGAIAFLSLVLGALINALLEYSLWVSWVIPASLLVSFALLSDVATGGGYGPTLGALTGAAVGLVLAAILSRLSGTLAGARHRNRQ